MEYEVVKVIVLLLGGFSTILGILVLINKPNKEQQKEQQEFNAKQQEVLTKLQITIAELNITLKKANEMDVARDVKIKEIDDRSWGNFIEIDKLKDKHFKKVY